MKRLFILLLTVLFTYSTDAQILIPLLFGDKINANENIDFGIQGGVNWSDIWGLDGSQTISKANLGIYFDIRVKNTSPWYVHTGLFAVSSMGAGNLDVYATGSADLDKLMSGGSVKRVLNYFSLPVMAKYMFNNAIFLEGGTQLGLMYKAVDHFHAHLSDGKTLNLDNNIGEQYRKFDIGITAGLGYRIPKGNGINLSARYYMGLVDIAKEKGLKQFNRSVYLVIGFPVGAKVPKSE